MGRTVSQVAQLAGVTVRALHHWDELGLLVPSDRTRAGYRLYTDADVARLREIVTFRALGFSLEAIAALLAGGPDDRRAALHGQRQRLVAQRHETDTMIRAVDAALDTLDGKDPMSDDDLLQAITRHTAQHADEVTERWGETAAYAESARRTRDYDASTWVAIRAESAAVESALAALLARGVAANTAEARGLAEQHRLHIDRWFYPCSREMHAALGEMYVADARFTAHYERVAPGLASFLRDAIAANAT